MTIKTDFRNYRKVAICSQCSSDVMIVNTPDGPAYRQHVQSKGQPCPMSSKAFKAEEAKEKTQP